MKLHRFALIILCLIHTSWSFANVTLVEATVDKNPIMADEAFTLQVRAHGDTSQADLDTSVLLNNFIVGRTNTSSQTQIINGRTSQFKSWTTTLIPKKEGQYTIPAFTIDGQSSRPITVRILPVSTSNKGRDAYIETSVDLSTVYLHQQLNYTMKLFVGPPLEQGSLTQPTLENSDIRQIGEDKNTQEIIDGKRYQVIERSYAIVPQESGKFVINAAVFKGILSDNSRRGFASFSRGKPITRVGQQIEIEVLPVPENYTYPWLPSEFVQINDEWQSPINSLKVGEPITRTITLTALGVVEEQLPDIEQDYPSSMKTYPDQANTATVQRDNNLIAQKVVSVALIPSVAGELTLPEVNVPWFNTLTRETEFATLPSQTVVIQPAEASSQPSSIPQNFVPPQSTLAQPVTNSNTPPPAVIIQKHWWSWSSWVLLVLWMLSSIMWIRAKTSTSIKPSKPSASLNKNEEHLWKTLQQSLKQDDIGAIQQSLTLWLQQLLRKPQSTLPDLQHALNNQEVNEQVNLMLASCYSQTSAKWQPAQLRKALTAARETCKNAEKGNEELPSLYPQ